MANYASIKEQILRSGTEQKVLVNQKHLIDKILARYSADFTVYRELLQNSDDAQSTEAEIEFQRSNGKGKYNTVIYRNNGMPFRPQDWDRLRTIAEGNPDESKIGFFGVGFYSAFSICDEPMVISGGEVLAFKWSGNQLKTVTGTHQASGARGMKTEFVFDLREALEVPNAGDFGRFLCNSLAFTRNLKTVSVFVDGQPLLRLYKRLSEAQPLVVLPKADRGKPSLWSAISGSHHTLFTLKEAEIRHISLHVEFHNAHGGASESSISLQLGTGKVAVSAGDMAAQMERVTKKKPPSLMDVHIIYNSAEKNAKRLAAAPAASSESTPSGSLMTSLSSAVGAFSSLLGVASAGKEERSMAPEEAFFRDFDPAKSAGKVFIGFPTHQTTGSLFHLSTALIPTVERENIDFVDPVLSAWNSKLLVTSGLLARAMYESMSPSIAQGEFARLDASGQDRELVHGYAAHILKTFTATKTTPHGAVGELIAKGFFSTDLPPPSVLAGDAVVPSTSAVVPNHGLERFVTQSLKVCPANICAECKEFIAELVRQRLTRALTLEDLFVELNARPMSPDDTVELLKWWIAKMARTSAEAEAHKTYTARLHDTLRIHGSGAPTHLKNYVYFTHNKSFDPAPDAVLPPAISSQLTKQELLRLGFAELSIVEWIYYLGDHRSELVEHSPADAERILAVLSRHFASLSTENQRSIVARMGLLQCIPTTRGMSLPEAAYFSTVSFFPDLPHVHLEDKQHVSKALLTALGVRDRVSLALVFERIDTLKWDTYALIKYLASVQGELTPAERQHLASKAFLESGDPKETRRFPANQLYVPTDEMRQLKLPVIQWHGKWRPNAPEAKFVTAIGLRDHPTAEALVSLAAGSDPAIRNQALSFLCEHFKTWYSASYTPTRYTAPYLPCTVIPAPGEAPTPLLCLPKDCVSSGDARVLIGVAVLDEKWRSHARDLGVPVNPSAPRICEAVQKHLPTLESAPAVFAYLNTCRAELSERNGWSLLSHMAFIPVQRQGGDKAPVVYLRPNMVFFRGNDVRYEGIFEYVDFGLAGNQFLRECGVKDEPAPAELAQALSSNPQQFMDSLGDPRAYLEVLRECAVHFRGFKSDLKAAMARAPCMVGWQRDDSAHRQANEENDETLEVGHYVLCKASDCVIVDDTVLQQLFNPLSAPMEQLLETMYESLGALYLSRAVKQTVSLRGTARVTPQAQSVADLIHRRAPLLLYNSTGGMDGKVTAGNALQLLAGIEVLEVDDIVTSSTLKGVERTRRTSAHKGTIGLLKKPCILIAGATDYYDVGNVLAQMISSKARPNDALLLATLLQTPLSSLRAKGFPVDRLLSKPKAEAKAKAIHRPTAQPPAAHEMHHQADRSAATPDCPPPEYSAQAPREPLSDKQVAEYMKQLEVMFPDCERAYMEGLLRQSRDFERTVDQLLQGQYPRNSQSGAGAGADSPAGPSKGSGSSVFGDGGALSRKLSGGKSLKNRLSKMFSHAPAPLVSGPSASGSATQQPMIKHTPTPAGPRGGDGTANASTQAALEASLRNAVKNCRSGNGADIDSAPQPISQEVKESEVRCEVMPGHRLAFAVKIDGIDAYIEKSLPASTYAEHQLAAAAFAGLLKTLQGVFKLPFNAIHMYYDEPPGRTVAFNRGNALYFNLRYFIQLQYSAGLASTVETYAYWYMTFCHELAHAFTPMHDESHGFYTSSFAETYFRGFATAMLQAGLLGLAP